MDRWQVLSIMLLILNLYLIPDVGLPRRLTVEVTLKVKLRKKDMTKSPKLTKQNIFLVTSFQLVSFQQVLAHTGHGFTKELEKRTKLSWKEVL